MYRISVLAQPASDIAAAHDHRIIYSSRRFDRVALLPHPFLRFWRLHGWFRHVHDGLSGAESALAFPSS